MKGSGYTLSFPLTFILPLLKLCSGEFEPAYLKVCGKEHKYFLDSYQCDKGLWLRERISPGCVCVRGVWALSSGFCDQHAVILVGDGNCFHVDTPIHSVKLIGDPKDPFKPSVYYMPRSVDAIFELNEKNFTPPIRNEEVMLVGVNPRNVAQRRDKKLCLDLDPKDYDKPVHIFVAPRRSLKEWTLNKKNHYSCPAVQGYHHHVGFGDMFKDNRVKERLLVERNCKLECPGDGGSSTPTKASDRTSPKGRWLVRSKKIFKTIKERNEERDQLRAQFTQPTDYYEKEVNEQTLRMMHAHISSVLLSLPSHQVVTKEYRYFQRIRKVVEKACPQEYVPKMVVTGLMRMFRQLLWETQDGYYQHVHSNDEGLFDRIMGKLEECEAKTPEPSVSFATYSESYNKAEAESSKKKVVSSDKLGSSNKTDPSNKTESSNTTEVDSPPPMEPPKPERCPVPLIFAVQGKEGNLFIRNFTNIFQPHLKFNSSQVDFVIETAWKLAMIGHYRCSKYFDDQTAIEFSHFFSQIQSFFNPRIIKRWYYPRSVNATLNIVKMIFPSYDLKKFMFGLDSCLFGTQGFSYFDFSNVWLQRPKVPMTENDINQKKFVMAGATSLLSTLDYAPHMVSINKNKTNMGGDGKAASGNQTNMNPGGEGNMTSTNQSMINPGGGGNMTSANETKMDAGGKGKVASANGTKTDSSGVDGKATSADDAKTDSDSGGGGKAKSANETETSPDGEEKSGTRKKRDAGGYYLWNQQGRCLESYMDPVRRAEFRYHLPRDCVPPVDIRDLKYL